MSCAARDGLEINLLLRNCGGNNDGHIPARVLKRASFAEWFSLLPNYEREIAPHLEAATDIRLEAIFSTTLPRHESRDIGRYDVGVV
jgi:hypothetical protein